METAREFPIYDNKSERKNEPQKLKKIAMKNSNWDGDGRDGLKPPIYVRQLL